jgi:hypothetical protein
MKALKIIHVRIWVAMGIERPGVGVFAKAFHFLRLRHIVQVE